MKKILVAITLLLGVLLGYSQVPNGFNYQAVLRNSSGDLIADQSVDIEISIIDENSGGTVLYTETHTKITNSYGLVNLVIGSETPDLGVFEDVIWAVNDKYIQIKVNAGSGLTDMGTFQLLTVPFAMHAASATNLGSENVYTGTDTLFVVKDSEGNPVFVVFPDGAKVIVDEVAKGRVGGFAVSGRSPTKADETDILIVTPDSTRIFVNDTVQSKGRVGGFAVSGRSPTKGISKEYLVVTQDSTRVYISDTSITKGRVGGFAVSGRSPTKAETKDYFNISGSQNVDTVNSEPRIFWYPKKEAFLAGRVLVESPDSVGTNSFAIGYESKAIGDYSQAMGYKNIARGNYSLAIGREAVAGGDGDSLSFALGYLVEATKTSSFAMGMGAKATSQYAYAFGIGAIASGGNSTATGFNTSASGNHSHASGYVTTASGIYSNASGDRSRASGNVSFAFGTLCQATGNYSTAIGASTDSWGAYSFSAGEYIDNLADYSTAFGRGHSIPDTATGSFAGGYANGLNGAYSFAVGLSNSSDGDYSAAVGTANQSNGEGSFTWGQSNIASGDYALAGGYDTEATADYAFSMGNNTSVSGPYSVAFGTNSSVTTAFSITSGSNNTVSGTFSAAIGFMNTASGSRSFAIGHGANSSGWCSLSGGMGNTSSGDYSTALGQNNTSQPGWSFYMGRYAVTEGTTNTWVDTEPLFVIGNGTADGSRSNALTILKNGEVYFPAVYSTTVTGSSLMISSTGKLGLATSSARFKKSIFDMENIDWIYKLRPVNFIYKDDPNDRKQYGLIAEEVEIINPLFVGYNPEGEIHTVNYANLITPVIKALQEHEKRSIEQQQIIENQKSKISELESRLAKLEKLLLEK